MKITNSKTKGITITFCKSDQIYCSKNYISNGHFLIKRNELAEKNIKYKFPTDEITKAFLTEENFRYQSGSFDKGDINLPDMAAMFNAADKAIYEVKSLQCNLLSGQYVEHVLETMTPYDEKVIFVIDENYMPLFEYGAAFGDGVDGQPIFVRNKDGETTILIMPMLEVKHPVLTTLKQTPVKKSNAEVLREASGGIWGEHPEFGGADWLLEVTSNNTRLGYWEWVASNVEQKEAENA